MIPIKVLQINAGSKTFGGVSSMLLNLYRNMDRDVVQFDFLTPNISTYTEYKAELELMGAHVYQLGINASSTSGKVKFSMALQAFLREHSYDIIHINSGVLLFNYVAADASRRASQAKIVVHSHSNGGRARWKDAVSLPLKNRLASMADLLLACSDSAAEYMFPKKEAENDTIIIKNGINVAKFSFNPEIRDELRKKMGLEGKYVIGHVGRFMPEKNHEFILRVFEEAACRDNGAVLMLIGEGELETKIRKKVNAMGLEDRVLFMGLRKDVERLYQVMDVFFLPSVFEGFGIVNIEAQASGLHCLTSDTVPAEVDVSGLVTRLSLSENITVWVNKLLSYKTTDRADGSNMVRASGYDIKTVAEELKDYYRNLLRK